MTAFKEAVSDINPFRHQRQFTYAPFIYPTVRDFFLVGGYSCGKSFSIVLLILNIVNIYDGHEITIGLGSVTISLFRKTIWVDLERILKMSGSKYNYDRQQNIIRIGTVSFQVIPIENPANIYAYNFCAFICDEIDELPQEKALMAFTAIHERTRIIFPDGRGAFACFATTAQGLKGCYQITEELRKKGKSFILIHGHTRDNTSIDKEYLRDLESLYDEKEKEAFLEGKFVNLSTGRVYGDYDPKVNQCLAFDIDPDETIYIGQDKNIGFCWAVAIIKRNGKLYIHRNFNFDSLGSAPREMRDAYPTNPIKWYPDASAEEIINIYIKEIRQFGIQPVMSGHNPSVQERIFCVNKMFKTNLMYVMQNGMTDDIDMSLKVRQFNDLGEPQKGRGEKSPDHVVDALEYVCFRLIVTEVEFRSIYEVAKHMNQAQKLRIGKAA